ncbi:hypothetical protein BST28156_02321 [Burkholderia stagnalis]|nr:hypothetical protein BST28156_02321 [Burkholderia stagnalis]
MRAVREHERREARIGRLVRVARPCDERVAIRGAGLGEQRAGERVARRAAVERLLRVRERAHAEPRAACLVARRKAEAARDPARAGRIERRRDAAGAERDDEPRRAAVRADDRRVGIAFDRQRIERRLRAKRREPARIVHARQPAAERAARPVERDARLGECVRARDPDRRPRALDAEAEPRRAAAPLRELAALPIRQHRAGAGAAAVDADRVKNFRHHFILPIRTGAKLNRIGAARPSAVRPALPRAGASAMLARSNRHGKRGRRWRSGATG